MASSFGAELDSLADMVTFGVTPALLAKSIVQQECGGVVHPKVATVLAAVYVLGAALRLARYNVESSRITEPGHVTRVFRGLPSPAAAGVIASLVLLRHEYDLQAIPWAFAVATPVLGLLMVSRFAYAHLMNRYLTGSRTPAAILLLLVAVFLIVEYPEAALAGVFVAYAVSGPLLSLARMTIGRPRWADEEDDDEEDLFPVAPDDEVPGS
jgi:CDP-diacylglycerol--serine O-phosphatidyltransferase